MRRVSLWVAGLGLVLGVLATVLAIWRPSNWLGYLLLGSAATGGLLIAALGAVGERRSERTSDRGIRRLPDLSLPTVLVVVGIAVALDGLAFGLWLVLIGLGLIALGIVVLARELAAERRGPA